ncbi:hypothetical protein [Microseira wollei]|uniref:hypothetical protein n=1 Tax=Microseira wollei TaxID=467598 RepID=UPI001CFD5883|nr:hypothetical protein [Microseira wollei]
MATREQGLTFVSFLVVGKSWDSWDFRGLWNQSVLVEQSFPPNNLPLSYPVPWQVYPGS